MCLVHGDDYFSAGNGAELVWFEGELRKEYGLKTQRLGPGAAEEGKVLNRIVRWKDDGWELEADPRHSELIREQLGVKKSGGITTAGPPQEESATEENKELLTGKDITLFRGVAARCNYLSLDRPDLQYAAKEICREMSAPTLQAFDKLKRIGQFLAGKPRLVWRYEYQPPTAHIDVFVDAHWAACKRSRKSTSGGCAMVGRHCVKTWSMTQATVAKSSAGSELYSVVRGSAEGLGLITMGKYFGAEFTVTVHVDANAAKGIV